MPIYAYRCASCGHAQDVLQKMSDPVLSVCPACGAATYEKQVTAAGFQLKGSGWYVTDFRGGSGPVPAKEGDAAKTGESAAEPAGGAAAASGESAAKKPPEPTASPAAAPAPAPAAAAPPPASST
jgi:putative FmdB family regulatory protein